MTQAEQLIRELRKGWRTWGDLEALRISNCPWRRLSADEKPERFLRKGERIVKQERSGILHLRVVTI